MAQTAFSKVRPAPRKDRTFEVGSELITVPAGFLAKEVWHASFGQARKGIRRGALPMLRVASDVLAARTQVDPLLNGGWLNKYANA